MPSTTAPAGTDPLVGFSFMFDVQGTVTGYFMQVEGLGSETEVIEHKVVNEKGFDAVMKIPGRLKWGDITLKRGITEDMQLWKWRQQVEEGKVKDARKNGSIMMCDQTGAVVAQWDFVEAWPSKISGPSISADSSDIGVEELTIAHEGIERVK